MRLPLRECRLILLFSGYLSTEVGQTFYYHWPEDLSDNPRIRLFLVNAPASPNPGLSIARCLASIVDDRGESVFTLMKLFI